MAPDNKVQTITYMPGEYILREGAQCDALFIVKSGQIQVFRIDVHKHKIPIALVQSGEYLGEMSLISNRPHSANAVAITPTVCVKITSEVLEQQLKTVPKWLTALTRGLVFKLHKTNDVLKRNGIVDEIISSAVKAIQDKENKVA